MREVTYSCTVTRRDGKIVAIPADDTAAQQRSSFMFECAKILENNPSMTKIDTRCTMKIISERKAWRESVRSSYFAFIYDCLSRGNESFTSQYMSERNRTQMVMRCHETLKFEYCKLNPDHYSTVRVRMPDGSIGDVNTVFTMSDKITSNEIKLRKLTDNELRCYVVWAKEILEAASGVTYTGVNYDKRIA